MGAFQAEHVNRLPVVWRGSANFVGRGALVLLAGGQDATRSHHFTVAVL